MRSDFLMALLTLLLLPVGLAGAAEPAELTGTVTTAAGVPAADALVFLVEARLETTTDAQGQFEFPDLTPGNYLLSVSSPRSGGAMLQVQVEGPTTVAIELDQLVHSETITVTSTGFARRATEVIQPVDLLGGDELLLRREATLGETLAQQPGVASTGYGRGASRPVIRGLGGDRVRLLENGLDSGDVSALGPDHQVSIDPLTTEHIEVVRGPGTLLYGGTAIGGVVNVIDSRIPDRPADRPLSGTIDIGAATNADEYTASVRLDGGSGRIAWHADAYLRDAGDYTSPARHRAAGEEDHDEETEWQRGTVANTASQATGTTLGLSWIGDSGYIGVAVSGLSSEYGIPGHGHAEHGHEEAGHNDEDERVTSELEQRRADLHGQLDNPFPGIRAIRLRMGWRDYQHQEIEGDEVGTRFDNQLGELRLEGLLAPIAGFEGTAGIHVISRDFAARGEEAFVQPSDTTSLAAFLYEESQADPVGLQLGLRYQHQQTEIADPSLPSRSFAALSASLGLAYAPSEPWRLTISVSRNERAPTAEELYSNGPHAATRAFEVGDPNLRSEIAHGVDISFRHHAERTDLELSLFANRFDHFIYLRDTGSELDELRLMQFVQSAADLYGYELHGGYELLHAEPHHLHLELIYDQVRAELRSTGEPLPRTPPRSARLGLLYLGDRLQGRVELRWVDRQSRTAALEEATPGYTMINAGIGWRFLASGSAHELMLRATNLSNQKAYNHVSFLRDEAPLPGRNLSLIYRLHF
jgi:iron complex outermembrane receptor protein